MYSRCEHLEITAHRDVPKISFVRSFLPKLRNRIRATKMSFQGAGYSVKMYSVIKE